MVVAGSITRERNCMKLDFLLPLLVCSTAVFGAKAVSLEKLRVRNQIAGWVEEKKSYHPFTTTTIFDIINGGATEYIENGMRKGFFQRLKNSDSATIELFAEDFAVAANAQKMFDAKKASFSQTVENTDTSNVIINEILGGFWACGIAGPFYFEFTVTGIKDRVQAETLIDTFIEYYSGKITP